MGRGGLVERYFQTYYNHHMALVRVSSGMEKCGTQFFGSSANLHIFISFLSLIWMDKIILDHSYRNVHNLKSTYTFSQKIAIFKISD